MPTTNREEALFAAALEKPTPAERAAYLEGACGDDHALRARIEALLAAHEAAIGVLDAPPLTPTGAYQPLTEGPGTVIGPYKLLQQIGEGGMGVVYMAEQQEPVRRKVALKIIKPGMDSRQVIARFEAERQALAMMDHQNIARVLDAGTTASGRPYFVMELVHGVPITQYCDDHQLTLRERLALVVPVCHAIQHAHQKGIIHRDIKPSNVLVTMYDDRPVPKVIDFGVAKAIEQRLTEKSLFTHFGALVGTFEYMSPEQAEMNAFGVDTRSDIYSLGVLLYELLTGTTPLERARLRAAALDQMVRLIKEEEAPRPSARLSSSNDLPKIAAARRTEPARLSKLIRGEIDWIVMKCLEKDRSRRYETANGVARDVERYLADEAVEACPPSAGYRLRKLARKYKKVLATAAAFAALLVAGVVVSTLLAVWARSAENEANRQRIASDTAKQEAVSAKVEADKERDEARRTAYAVGINLAQRAWEENNITRVRELLEEVPKEAGGRDLRGFEWYYLFRLCHLEILSLEGYIKAFSPDGLRLASASTDNTVKVWDSATGKELISLKGHTQQVLSVAFSPDGQRLAAGSRDNMVKIWDVVTGKELVSLTGHTREVVCLAFSPDGQRLASASFDKTVKIWASATGKELFSLKGYTDPVHTLAFSPDGRRLASGSWLSTVKIWDSATGKELLSLDEAGASVAFSPDGLHLASRKQDNTLKIWNSLTGEELCSLKGRADERPDEAVADVAFSPDSWVLALQSIDKVKIWDRLTGKEPFSIDGGFYGPLAFSPDGRRLAAGKVILDSLTGKTLVSLKGQTDAVESVSFNPDGQRLASGSKDKTVKIWDSATGKELLSLKGHAEAVTSVAFSPDGRHLASGSLDKTVKIWDSATGEELFSLKGHGGKVLSVAFSSDGRRLASGSADKTVKVWGVAAGTELFALKGHTDAVESVSFSPDEQRLASGSKDKTVKVWDSATGKELLSLTGHAEAVRSVAFSPDGQRLAAGSDDRTVKIWDSAIGKELLSLKTRVGVGMSVAFSPDGRRLASTNLPPLGLGAGSIHLWETSVPPEVQERRAVDQLVNDLFDQLALRDDVLERLRTMPGISPSRRLAALATAQMRPDDRDRLNIIAWELARRPGRGLSAYRRALHYSELACQLEPKNSNHLNAYLNTLGVAYYRVGDYEKALETLLSYKSSNPADLAFLAMTHHRLGHAQEAQTYLQRLRERVKDLGWMEAVEAEVFLHEAEALLAKPAPAGDK